MEKTKFYKKKWFEILLIFIFPFINFIYINKKKSNILIKIFLNILLFFWSCFWLLFVVAIINVNTVNNMANKIGTTTTTIQKVGNNIDADITKHDYKPTSDQSSTNQVSSTQPVQHAQPVQQVNANQSSGRALSYSGIIKTLGTGYDEVHLHSQPSSSSYTITKLSGGTPVQILSSSNEWDYVQLQNNDVGYVYSPFIKRN